MKLTIEQAETRMDSFGNLDLYGAQITAKSVRRPQEGKYVPGRYLYADGILTHVKKRRQAGGYTVYVGKIPGQNVVSDGKNYAHCNRLREGIADLLFKAAADRGADQYRELTPDSVLSIDEGAAMYRIITGACRAGTERFLNSLKERKEAYAVREILEMTKGQYGWERLAEFFGK